MVIAVDVGTSSVRAALYDEAGQAIDGRFHQVPCAPRVSRDGGVEHDADRLFQAVTACLDGLLAPPGVPPVEAVGVTTFWHGLLGLDVDGQALTPILTWADTRAAGEARRLRETEDAAVLHALTGCPVHACYWPAKLGWVRRAWPERVQRVARWGSFGEFLELRLRGEARTSLSIASGTGLLDHDLARWSPRMLALAGIAEDRLFPLSDLAETRRGLRPEWAARWPALRGSAWLPAVGDGAASSVGSGCMDPARMALNVGTSAALRLVTGPPARPVTGLWRYRLDRRRSLTGGATSEGGNVFEWCQRVLRLPDDAAVEEALARSADARHHGLAVLPFLAGERAPGWRDDRRAVLAGLTLDTSAADVLRAALEAVALRLALIHDLLGPLAPADHRIVVSGAALARSPGWARIVADALGRPLHVCAEDEATSRGAALLALEALGALRDAAEAPVGTRAVVEPDPGRHERLREALERQQDLDHRLS